MTIDWTPVVETAVAVATTVLPAAALAFAAWLRSHNHKVLADAVQIGGGVAYDTLVAVTREGNVDWHAAKNVAMASGVRAVQDLVSSTNTEKVATQVQGALGKLLASDPTVSAGGGSTATATAGPGQIATAEAGCHGAAALPSLPVKP